MFLRLSAICVVVSSICAAPFSNMCSTRADNNSRKSRLRCGCQFPWLCPQPVFGRVSLFRVCLLSCGRSHDQRVETSAVGQVTSSRSLEKLRIAHLSKKSSSSFSEAPSVSSVISTTRHWSLPPSTRTVLHVYFHSTSVSRLSSPISYWSCIA
jgi:hypothetical protein